MILGPTRSNSISDPWRAAPSICSNLVFGSDRSRPAHEWGSLVLGHAVSMVSIDPQGHHDHPAGDPCALAPGRLPAILAVEIPLPWRATARVRFNWHAQRGPLSTK